MYGERECTFQQALRMFHHEISKLNLCCRLSFLGTDPKTTSCVLLYPDDSPADIGNGKGIGIESEVSAKYEALEHYLSTKKSFLKKSCRLFSLKEIEQNFSEVNAKIVPMSLKTQKEQRTPWVAMQKFCGNSFIYFPYFLVNPDYRKNPFLYDEVNYGCLSELPTNNGTAIGTTFQESMLHAINELIERDAISCFLLTTFCKKHPQKIKIVNKKSLTNSLKDLIERLEYDYNEEILIIDISNDLNVPVFFATFSKQKQCIQPIGAGASLNPEYALQRAVLEALQALHLTDKHSELEDQKVLQRFSLWPKLQKCAKCDFTSIIEIGNFEYVELKRTKKIKYGVSEILVETMRILENNSFSVFYAKHYESKHGITCVKVVIPGTEQFHRIRYGSFVIPGERGQSILLD